jgi:hypothetical protein
MKFMHLYLDHIVVALHDLEEAIRDYSALGFTVLRGGVHSNGATHNALIAFEDGSYIELLASTGAAPLPGFMDWSILLQNGEGLAAYALRTGNIKAEAARLKVNGIAIGEITAGQRQRSDGATIQWKLMQIEGGFTPFVIQDITPHELRVPDDMSATTHANRAISLAGLRIAALSITPPRDRLHKIVGLKPQLLRLGVTLPLKNGFIRFIQANPALLHRDWEAEYRSDKHFYSEAVQKFDSSDSPTLALMQEGNRHIYEGIRYEYEREKAIWKALHEGQKSEALWSTTSDSPSAGHWL